MSSERVTDMAKRWLREADAELDDDDVDDTLRTLVNAWAERRSMIGDRRVAIVQQTLTKLIDAAKPRRR